MKRNRLSKYLFCPTNRLTDWSLQLYNRLLNEKPPHFYYIAENESGKKKADCELRWEECVGFIWLHRWHTHTHTHRHTQKKLNVSMQQYGCLLSNTSPWIVKHETHKPFLSFVFQTRKKKKKPVVSPWSWLNMACFEQRYTFTFLELGRYPHRSSPVYLSETLGFWWIPLSRPVCSWHNDTVRGNDLLIWGREIMCWAITGDLLYRLSLIWSSSRWSVPFIKAELTWTGLSHWFSSRIQQFWAKISSLTCYLPEYTSAVKLKKGFRRSF